MFSCVCLFVLFRKILVGKITERLLVEVKKVGRLLSFGLH